MNREMKFRAWHTNLSKMITVENSYQDIYVTLSGKPCSEGDVGTLRNPEPYFPWIRNEISLMQYTGLKDKNGVEIYEGDIYHQGDEKIKYKVIFKNGCFVGNQIGNKSTAGLSAFIEYVEVIGNVHENPELLK